MLLTAQQKLEFGPEIQPAMDRRLTKGTMSSRVCPNQKRKVQCASGSTPWIVLCGPRRKRVRRQTKKKAPTAAWKKSKSVTAFLKTRRRTLYVRCLSQTSGLMPSLTRKPRRPQKLTMTVTMPSIWTATCAFVT